MFKYADILLVLVTSLKTANELLKAEYIHNVGLLGYDAV